ncbi:MAG: cache domain-containing protein [Bryobacteraceae bacterium]
MDRFEVRVSITKLVLILLVVIVPLSIIGLILTQRSDRATDNSIGTDFKTIAQMYSNDVSQIMRDRVAAVRALATDPAIVAATSGTRKGGAAESNAAPASMLASTGSQLLHQRRALDPRYLSIVVTDLSGNVVAASQAPPKMSYAQDAYWQSVYNNGQESVKISDIIDDEFTKSYYVNIGAPVTDPASGAATGILSAAVSISDLMLRFRQDQIANGARAELVSDDGTIVSAPNADVFSRTKSQQFDAIRDQLGSLQGTQNGWQMASLRNGPYIVGYAATGLKQHYDNLGWIVLVSQEEHQAAAPIRELEHFALIMVILALFMLTLLCVYYFIHRTQKFEDLESALPPEATRTRTASA